MWNEQKIIKDIVWLSHFLTEERPEFADLKLQYKHTDIFLHYVLQTSWPISGHHSFHQAATALTTFYQQWIKKQAALDFQSASGKKLKAIKQCLWGLRGYSCVLTNSGY